MKLKEMHISDQKIGQGFLLTGMLSPMMEQEMQKIWVPMILIRKRGASLMGKKKVEQETLMLSVRLWHPTLKAEEITGNIERKPDISRTVGEYFITPAGKVLERINKETYVVYSFGKNTNNDLSDALEKANSFLSNYLDFLKNFKVVGGGIDYYITIISKPKYVFVLPPKILEDCASLGVEIGVEIYSDIEEDTD